MKIQVCNGKKCKLNFSEYIYRRLDSDIKRFKLENITLESSECLGDCKKGPIVIIDGKTEYCCTPIKASKIMFEKIKKRQKPNKKSK